MAFESEPNLPYLNPLNAPTIFERLVILAMHFIDFSGL
jgi:hypothetical protein